MKKIFYLACLIVLAVVLFAGCDDPKRIANETERIAKATEDIAAAAEAGAKAAEKTATATEAMVPQKISDFTSGSTIGWGALTSSVCDEIIRIGESNPFGGTIQPDHTVKSVDLILYLEGLPAEPRKQSLIMYTYENETGTGQNIILVQGHFEEIQSVNSIPDLLNTTSCCFKYGGIGQYKNNVPLPPAKDCTPCKQTKKEEPCLPCQGQPGIVIKNDDGEIHNSPATSRKLPPRRSR